MNQTEVENKFILSMQALRKLVQWCARFEFYEDGKMRVMPAVKDARHIMANLADDYNDVMLKHKNDRAGLVQPTEQTGSEVLS